MRKRKENIVGKKYGRLTVKEYIDNTHVLCECECGTVKSYCINNIKYGRTKSCGCLSKEKLKERCMDLSGQQFGELKVISYAGYRNGRTAWNCECSCGKHCVVTGHGLRSGHTKSCGCARKGKGIVDLKGYRSGYLIALEATEKRTPKGSVIWKCLCLNCGKTTEISEDSLKHGHNKSCGCLRVSNVKKLHETMHFYGGTCLEFLDRKKRVDNKTGYTGVYEHGKNYRAMITFMGKKYNLGTYKTIEKAAIVRNDAEETLFQTFIRCYSKWLLENEGKEKPEAFEFDVKQIQNKLIVKTNIE